MFAIIYQEVGQPVAVMASCNPTIPLDKIGLKCVPQGVAFWVVPEDSLPEDKSFRQAWELDLSVMGEPTGFGDINAFNTWKEGEFTE